MRDELKAVIREEPGIQATLADVDAEFEQAFASVTALQEKRSELQAKLHAIAEAKEQLAALPSDATEVADIEAIEVEGVEASAATIIATAGETDLENTGEIGQVETVSTCSEPAEE